MSNTKNHDRASSGYAKNQAKANTGRKRRTNRALRRTEKTPFKRGAWSYRKMIIPSIEEES